MNRSGFVFAVAALAATALSFSTQNAAQAYCRGCAVEGADADAARGAAASAMIEQALANSANPPGVDHVPAPDVSINHHDSAENAMNSAACHTKRQQVTVEGRRRWENVEICE